MSVELRDLTTGYFTISWDPYSLYQLSGRAETGTTPREVAKLSAIKIHVQTGVETHPTLSANELVEPMETRLGEVKWKCIQRSKVIRTKHNELKLLSAVMVMIMIFVAITNYFTLGIYSIPASCIGLLLSIAGVLIIMSTTPKVE